VTVTTRTNEATSAADRLDRQGWTTLEEVLTDDECRDLLAACEGRRWPHIPSELVRWILDPRWAALALHRLGPEVRFLREQVVTKASGAPTVIPWHQDSGYAPIAGELLTYFVALDDITLDNGCLWMLDGSHEQGLVEHTGVGYLREVAVPVREAGQPVELARGSAVAFSSFTLHRSGGNRTDGTRPAWMVQFCRSDALDGAAPTMRQGCPVVAERGAWLDQLRF
jgi:ectoine hydroxylase-related dioxygenase (phytanoyl-CoA dioxygenase family)